MREIKFRFFDGKKMCPVGELTFFEPSGYHINEEFPSTGKDPYPLMQFTGLKDRNNFEVYEGDTIRIFDGDSIWGGEIRWNNESADYEIYRDENFQRAIGIEGDVIEIVGNIYEDAKVLSDNKK